jgi:hypothetical protein
MAMKPEARVANMAVTWSRVPSRPTTNGLPHLLGRDTTTAPSGSRQPRPRDKRIRFAPKAGTPGV